MKENLSVSVMLGNSDNKLPQDRWATFVASVRAHVEKYACQIHMDGGPGTDSLWQNWCFMFVVEAEKVPGLVAALQETRGYYRQRGIAWMLGKVMFLEAGGVMHRDKPVDAATGLPVGWKDGDAERMKLQSAIDLLADGMRGVDVEKHSGMMLGVPTGAVQGLLRLASPQCKRCRLHHVGAVV